MNRFLILALVAVTAVSARSLETLEGANRGLKCVGTSCTSECSVKTAVEVELAIELKLRNACAEAVRRISTQICKDASGDLVNNQVIEKVLNFSATAVGQAVAEASIAIFSGVSYKGNCDYGSQGIVKARAVAKSYAAVTAKATAEALLKVYGKNTLKDVGVWIDATSVAITKACASAIVKGFSSYTYPVGPPTAEWVTFIQVPVKKVASAVATAIANAYVDIRTKITIDVDAKKFPCDFVCPTCPPF